MNDIELEKLLQKIAKLKEIVDQFNKQYEPEEYTQVDDAFSSGTKFGENIIKGKIKQILEG